MVLFAHVCSMQFEQFNAKLIIMLWDRFWLLQHCFLRIIHCSLGTRMKKRRKTAPLITDLPTSTLSRILVRIMAPEYALRPYFEKYAFSASSLLFYWKIWKTTGFNEANHAPAFFCKHPQNSSLLCKILWSAIALIKDVLSCLVHRRWIK